MFDAVRLTGSRASILWGYRTAAELTGWTVSRQGQKWTLRATVARLDAFQARQKPLLFTAPRPQGFWAWPIESLQWGSHHVVAQLGQPEH